jgi:DNA-binding LacI/PurR family transcriptional regulator
MSTPVDNSRCGAYLYAMATRAEVAKRAGVSASTVSYVLNGQRSISEATKARVMKAIHELNYRPHLAAGLLAGGKGRAIAMLIPGGRKGITSSAVEYINGATRAAADMGYHLILWPNELEKIDEIAALNTSGFIVGVLLMEIKMIDRRVEFFDNAHIPMTLIGRTNTPSSLNFVDRDFDGAAEMAINYLTELDHKYIALINNARFKTNSKHSVDHRFRQSVISSAKKAKISLAHFYYENDANTGEIALKEIMSTTPDTTAIVTLNDLTVIGLINSGTKSGLSFPEDLSVLSLSTSPSQVEMTVPEISTISPPAWEMGAKAIEILLKNIEEGSVSIKQELWAGELIIRGTTGRARVGKIASTHLKY